LRAPRWIVLTVLVIAFVVAFVNLGFWQLRRLDAKRAYNRQFIAREHQPEQPVEAIFPTLPVASSFADANAYRRATATGHFDTAHEVILLSRSFNGISGHHVLTPLVVAPGRALLVDRGWVNEDLRDPPVAQAAPPAGELTARGVLFPSQHRGLLGPKEPAGPASQFFRIEIPKLQKQMPYTLYPLYMQLLEQNPAQNGELPRLVAELPSLDEGPHLSYAIQWFCFAAVALATYLALFRRALIEPAEPA